LLGKREGYNHCDDGGGNRGKKKVREKTKNKNGIMDYRGGRERKKTDIKLENVEGSRDEIKIDTKGGRKGGRIWREGFQEVCFRGRQRKKGQSLYTSLRIDEKWGGLER